jgi:hypothetical protein
MSPSQADQWTHLIPVISLLQSEWFLFTCDPGWRPVTPAAWGLTLGYVRARLQRAGNTPGITPLSGTVDLFIFLMGMAFSYNLRDTRLNPTAGDHHRPSVGGIMTDYQIEAPKNHLRLPASRTSRSRSPGGWEAEGIGRFTPLVANHRSTDAGSVEARQKIRLTAVSADSQNIKSTVPESGVVS